MESNKSELPKNPIEAQWILIKAFYKNFGKEALPIIKEILRKQGKALGLKIKSKLPNTNLSTVANAFSKSFDPNNIKLISVSNEKFQIQGTRCPFGLENSSRELCENVMEIDHEYFRSAVSEDITLKIKKTVANRDLCCDTIYELKKE